FSAMLASQSAQTARMARVSGQVIEAGTDAPVAGATVFVMFGGEAPGPSAPAPTMVTDGDGRFAFDALPAGRYIIAAHKTGFAPPMDLWNTQTFEVSAGQTLEALTVHPSA